MRPAPYNFRFPRGGAAYLGVILHGRDPRTGEVSRLPIPGVTIEWTIAWPTGDEVRTQFAAPSHLLTIDPRSGVIGFPISAERAEELEGAVQPIATRIRLLMPDGVPVPFLVGTIALED